MIQLQCRIWELFNSITSVGNKDAVIDTRDKVTTAESAVSIIKKPVFKNEKVEEAKEAGEVKEAEEVKTEPATSAVTGAESIPGPSAAIVSAQLRKLEKTGVQFMQKRLVPVPFFKHKKIDSEKAASILVSGNEGRIGSLRVKAGDSIDPVPFTSLEDVGELSGFMGLGIMPSKEKEMADFMNYSRKIGLEFKTDDANNIGDYGAYNFLTTGWEIAGQSTKPVQLVREGVSIMTVKPGDKRTASELRKELEEAWNCMEDIKKMDCSKSIFKSFSKPLFGQSFTEKFRAWDVLDRYASGAVDKYNIIMKYAQNKEEFDEIVDILRNQGRGSYDNSFFSPDDTKLIMEKTLKDDASFTDKAKVIRDLKNITPRDIASDSGFMKKGFRLIQKKSNNGAEFVKNAKIYTDMVVAMKTQSRMHFRYNTDGMSAPKKAFEFIMEQLKGDEDDARAFTGLLHGSTVDEAMKRYQSFQTAVKSEDVHTRIEVSHALMDTKGYEDNYRTVLENLEPGENPQGLIKLVKMLRNYYEDDALNIKKTVVEVRERTAEAGGSIDKSNDIMESIASTMSVAMEAIGTVGKPLAGTGFDERADVFVAIRNKYPENLFSSDDKKKADMNAIKDYSVIVDSKVPTESLQNAVDRFNLILEKLGDGKNIEEVRDSYIMVSEGLKQGHGILTSELIQKALLNGKSKKEIGEILREGIKEAAGMSAGGPNTGTGKIEQDEEKVVIGGVKLDKQKYDNLLRILD